MAMSVVVAWTAYLQRNFVESSLPTHSKSLNVFPDVCAECTIKQTNSAMSAGPSLGVCPPSLANSWLGQWSSLSPSHLQRTKRMCEGWTVALLTTSCPRASRQIFSVSQDLVASSLTRDSFKAPQNSLALYVKQVIKKMKIPNFHIKGKCQSYLPGDKLFGQIIEVILKEWFSREPFTTLEQKLNIKRICAKYFISPLINMRICETL